MCIMCTTYQRKLTINFCMACFPAGVFRMERLELSFVLSKAVCLGVAMTIVTEIVRV